MAGAVGTATLDFGAAPGTNIVSVVSGSSGTVVVTTYVNGKLTVVVRNSL